jgi:thymidine kinase
MANLGKTVLVAALDATFQRQWFGNIVDLIPLAEHVIKLTAVCMSCFGEASYTKRISQDKEVEVIGGADKYMAVCRRCYHSVPSVIPSSPRDPLKSIVSNGNHVVDEEAIISTKKALFDDAASSKENGVVIS